MTVYPHKIYQIGPGLNAVLSKKDLTAKIIRSPDASGEIFIPRSIKHKFKMYTITRIDDEAFYQNTKIESLTFPNDSELESIGKEAFFESNLKSLQIPASLKEMDADWCRSTRKLSEIIVASSRYAWVDGKFLVAKSKEDGEFDTLLLASRTITGSVEIPASIKYIGPRAFQWCDKVQNISFNTVHLKEIGYGAFNNCLNLEKVDSIPPEVKDTGFGSFSGDAKLMEIQFSGEEILIRQDCFSHCTSLTKLSFPNAFNVTIEFQAFHEINTNLSLLLPPYCEINGPGLTDIESRIERITTEEVKNKVASIPNSVSAPVINNLKDKTFVHHRNDNDDDSIDTIQSAEDDNLYNISVLLKRIRFLEDRLSKYEHVNPFDISNYKSRLQSISSDTKTNESDDYEVDASSSICNIVSTEDSENNYIINDDSEDEKSFQVIKQIDENENSVLYKAFDCKKKNVVFKKLIKPGENNNSEEYFSNAIERFKILHAIDHPCIIHAIAINTHAKYIDEKDHQKKAKNHHKSGKVQFATAVYLEYLEFALSDCILYHALSNTLKARIAVEVACGISHLHNRGMIMHNLNLANIKLNGVYNAKIVGLGITDATGTIENDEDSKFEETKVFMSPEMASSGKFNNKTDIYSYGMVLYTIFTENVPDQSFDDKIAGVPIKLPQPSDSISELCIKIIQKCLSFNPDERPSIDDILNQMRDHSYCLASEIDSSVVLSRHQALNRFEALHRPPFQFS